MGSIVGAVGSIAGGLIGSSSAKKAARAQEKAAQRSQKIQQEQYYQTREDMAPSRQAGGRALSQYEQLLGLTGPSSQQQVAPQTMEQSQFEYLLGQLDEQKAERQAWQQYQQRPQKNRMIDASGIRGVMAQRQADAERAEYGGYTKSEFDDLKQRLALGVDIPENLDARTRAMLGVEGTEDTGYYYPGGAAQVAPTQDAALAGLASDGGIAPTGIAPAQDDQFAAFRQSPGYQFRMQEGLKALQRSAAARGQLQSGSTMKGITEYGQGMASQEYGDYMNRLAALSGVGQTATTQTGQFGQAMAGNVGQAMIQAGEARASGYAGAANAWGGALQGVGQAVGGMFGSGGGGDTYGSSGGYVAPWGPWR